MKGSDPYGSFQNQRVHFVIVLFQVSFRPQGCKLFSRGLAGFSLVQSLQSTYEAGIWCWREGWKDPEMYPSLQNLDPMLSSDLFRSVLEKSSAEAAEELGCVWQLSQRAPSIPQCKQWFCFVSFLTAAWCHHQRVPHCLKTKVFLSKQLSVSCSVSQRTGKVENQRTNQLPLSIPWALLQELQTLGLMGGFKACMYEKRIKQIAVSYSTNCILRELLFVLELRLPLVEVEVCLWEQGDKQVFSLVPVTKT